MSRLDDLIERLRPTRERLLEHRVYGAIGDLGALRVFLEHHAFAVWDFMSLLKALQRRLTCVDVPWVPRGDGVARHLINAIVLAEESDDDGRGGFASHYELYVDAMREAGADPSAVERLVGAIREGETPAIALARSGAPGPAARFVASTLEVAEAGSAPAIAAAFTLGREELIPDLFRGLVARIDAASTDPGSLGLFRHYLDRHVELDGDEHGPMALRMLAHLCGDSDRAWREAEAAAGLALEARLDLWDGIADAVEAAAVRA